MAASPTKLVRDALMTEGNLLSVFGNFNIAQSLASTVPPDFGDERWCSWRVFTKRMPRSPGGLIEFNTSSEQWVPMDRHILQNIRAMYGESTTAANASTLIRGMLGEYEGTVVYRNGKGSWQRYVPAKITAAILPMWYTWALAAFDELRMFGFTVLAFAPDPSAGGKLVDRRIAVTASFLDVDIYINTTATELRYEFTNEIAARKFKRVYIITDRMPRFGPGNANDELARQASYGMPEIDTPIARLLPLYYHLQRARRYDATALTIATTRPFLVQHNEKAELQKKSIFSLSCKGRQEFLEGPPDSTLDQAAEHAKRIVPLADPIQPVRAMSLPSALADPCGRANAGIISLHGDEQLAAIVPTKDYNPAMILAELDHKVASLSGYPLNAFLGTDSGKGKSRSSSSSSSSGSSSSSTKTIGLGSARTSKGAGGSITGSSSGSDLESGPSGADSQQGPANMIGNILLSSLEGLLSLAWNAAFSGVNTAMAVTMLAVINNAITSNPGRRTVQKVLRTCVPVVTLTLPCATVPSDIPLPVMQMLPFTEALLPLKLGITPRGYDRMTMFSHVHPEFKRRKLAAEEQDAQVLKAGVVPPSSSSSSSSSSHKK